MKLVSEYLANAVKFEHLARMETDPEVKAALKKQAAAYRSLAEQRAKQLGIPTPEKAS